MRWLSVEEAAKILYVNPGTIRQNETRDGMWSIVFGHRIRIYREGPRRARRFSEAEVRRVALFIQRDSIRS
jgi:hypothetical protein